jgi:hypothetical protein
LRRNRERLERAIYRALIHFCLNLQNNNEELTRAIEQKTTEGSKCVIHGREQLLAPFPGLTIDDGKFSGSLELGRSLPQS